MSSRKMDEGGYYHSGYQQNYRPGYSCSGQNCCLKCLRLLLGAMNTLALLGAIVTFVLGGIAYWGISVLNSLPLVSSIVAILPTSGVVADLVNLLGMVLMIWSAVVLVVTVVGCCGVTRFVRALILYSVLLGLVLAAEVVALLVYSQSPSVQQTATTSLWSSVNSTFGSFQDPFTNAQLISVISNLTTGNWLAALTSLITYASSVNNLLSLLWTLVMQLFKCCGLSNYTDYQLSTQWNRTFEVPGSSSDYQQGMYILSTVLGISGSWPTSRVNRTAVVPFGCCSFSNYSSIPGTQMYLPVTNSDFTNLNAGCIFSPGSNNSFIAQQCYYPVYSQLANLLTFPLIIFCVAIAVLLFVPFALAVTILCLTRPQYRV